MDIKDKTFILKLGDKDRNFRFSMTSYGLLAESYGSVEEAFEVLGKWFLGDREKNTLTAEIIRAMVDIIHSGLATCDKEITRDNVADLLDLNNLVSSLVVVFKARAASLPDSKEGGKPSDPQPA